MLKVAYDMVPLDCIRDGYLGLRLVPFLGNTSLDEMVRVRVCDHDGMGRLSGRRSGRVVCVYLLYYGSDWIKIGTSNCSNVVVRCYQQAPLAATVVGVFELEKHVGVEEIERRVVALLGREFKYLRMKKPPLNKITDAWMRVLSAGSDVNRQFSRVLRSEDASALFGKLPVKIWRILSDEFGAPLYEPGAFWFVPEFPLEFKGMPIRKCLVGSIMSLISLPNGLFYLETGGGRQASLYGGYLPFVVDFSVLNRYSFEVMSD